MNKFSLSTSISYEKQHAVYNIKKHTAGAGYLAAEYLWRFGFRHNMEQAKSYLRYWVETGKFGPDYDDKELVYLENKFTEYLDCYTEGIIDESK